MPDDDVLRDLHRQMVRSRLFEEALVEAYGEGKAPAFDIAAGPVPGEMHLSNGQEPVAAGVCAHLRPTDAVTATHRPHHEALAHGVDMRRMAAEVFGKETGLGRGKGGHMHLFSVEPAFGCSGIVAEGIPTAVGHALAFKKTGRDGVAVAFFGEGAANQGGFHEGLNLAALWQLPVVFVCEDNAWAISVPKAHATAIERTDARAAAYGMPGAHVSGNDPVAVWEVAGEAVGRARRGEGPTLIEVETDRLLGHFQGDAQVYRSAEQIAELERRDAIAAFERRLAADGVLSEQDAAAVREAAHAEVADAIAFARESPYPAPEEALENVFAS